MLTSGHTLQNRYTVGAHLGDGGMGSVHRAHDGRLNVDVAIKEFVPPPGLSPNEMAQLRAQFHQEATVLARLKHSGLVAVTDFFEEAGRVFLVMGLVPGENLAAYVHRFGPLPEADAVRLGAQLLEALEYCHQRQVLHRDIKPNNIILQPDGAAVLVDFGLVKLWNPANPTTFSLMRGIGTPHYASPEQYGLATGHTDARSDVYSVGATLYFALTGQAPPVATDRLLQPDIMPSLAVVAPGVSPGVAAVITQALSLRKEARFASAAAMRAALAGANWATPRAASAPGRPAAHATVTTAGASAPASPRRAWPIWLVPVGLALMAIIAFLAWQLVNSSLTAAVATEAVVTEAVATPSVVDALTAAPSPPLPATTAADGAVIAGPTVPTKTVPPSPVPTEIATIAPTAVDAPVIPAGGTVAAARISAPAIDGDLGEWAGQAAYDSPFLVYWDDGWDGTQDGSVRWHLGWDETNLYLAARVSDDLHVQTQSGNKIYLGDSLEIQIDTDGGAATSVSPREFQINLSPGDFASLLPSANLSQGTDAGGMFDAPAGHRIRMAAQRTSQGYTVEAAVPWADLFIVPATGQRMAIALNLDDNDRPSEAVQETMYSNAPDRLFLNPATWLPFSLMP